MQATVVFEWNWDAIHAVNEDGSRKFRYIINEGSSRSSKTYSIIDCFDLYGRENVNKRLTVWRDTKIDCRKTVLNDALRHFKETGRYLLDQEFNKTEAIFSYSSGSTFEIHGTDDEETVHGLNQAASWFNEPYKISRDTFDQIDQRTSDFIVLDWNPKKDHFIDDLKKDSRTIVIKSTFKDNPFCPPEQKAKILSYQPVSRSAVVESEKIQENDARVYDFGNNPLNFTAKELKELSRCIENERKASASNFKWSVYGLGEKAERPNRIFNFEEISLQEYQAIDAKIYSGCDWGQVDPWAILDVKYYDGALYVNELNYLSENQIKDKLTPLELSQVNAVEDGLIGWMFRKLCVDKDRLIICDPNRTFKIMALRAAGWEYAIAANKPPGSIIDGISGLSNLKVYYTSRSENFAYEQENYSRKVDRYGVVLEEPEDLDNHLMDALRYVYLFLKKEGIIKSI